MKKLLLLLLIFFTACVEDQSNQPQQPIIHQESEAFKKGKRQLEVMGYKNIKETSYPFFCCDKNDSFLLSTGFEAEDNTGEKVSGCFCVKGLIRNSVTIRFQ